MDNAPANLGIQKIQRILRECGLMYFRVDFKKGDSITVKSYFNDIQVGGHNVVLASGKLLFKHPNKDPQESILEPAKTLLFHGLTIPGDYTLTALEDSVYVCCTELRYLPIGVFPEMYKVDHKYLEQDEILSLESFENIKAVMVMTGHVKRLSDGSFCNFGNKIEVTKNDKVVAMEPVHLMIISE